MLTLAVGASFIALILLIEHRFHKIPAALVALVLGIAISAVLGLEARGVEVVGEVPAGLAPPKLPGITFNDLILLIPGAMGIALVNFAEAYGPARNFATKHRYKIDANQELIGLGAANLGAGLFQGFSIGSSLSKSAANDRAGAKTPVSLLVCAALTVVVALFFTPLFGPLPEAVLGAVVITAVIGMMKFKKMRRYLEVNRLDFWLALIAMLGVLTFEPLVGLLIAVVLSLILLVLRASRPKLKVLGRAPGRLNLVDTAQFPDATTVPGLLVIRPESEVFFANSGVLREEVLGLVQASDPPAKAVLLDLESTSELDAPERGSHQRNEGGTGAPGSEAHAGARARRCPGGSRPQRRHRRHRRGQLLSAHDGRHCGVPGGKRDVADADRDRPGGHSGARVACLGRREHAEGRRRRKSQVGCHPNLARRDQQRHERIK